MIDSPCPTRSRLLLPETDPLRAILVPDRVIAVRPRALSAAHSAAARIMLAHGPRLILARGTPDRLGRLLAPRMPADARILLDDALALAADYRTLAGLTEVRLRLERITTDSCRRFHVDRVGLRLLCTYVGPGTQWVPSHPADRMPHAEIDPASMRQIGTGDIAVLKGSAWPGGDGQGVLHRSPPLSHGPEAERVRLLLTIDAPDACGMMDDANPTIVT
ncbi:DUF1826 domain-containing protein [Nguyenibacter sp. L1]|nr:DUF1826 domain-containing protein [Nguyenibacter sp. L1]